MRYLVAFALILIAALLVGALIAWPLSQRGSRGRAWGSSIASWARCSASCAGAALMLAFVLVAGLTPLPRDRLVAEFGACAAARRRRRWR